MRHYTAHYYITYNILSYFDDCGESDELVPCNAMTIEKRVKFKAKSEERAYQFAEKFTEFIRRKYHPKARATVLLDIIQ